MKLTAYVTMPEIEGVSVSGSGKVINEGGISCDEVHLMLVEVEILSLMVFQRKK